MKIHFEEKCDALIEAIFSSSFEVVQKRPSKDLSLQRLLFDVINNFENRQHISKWEKVIYREIKNAIFLSSLKKGSNSDGILFLILQKSYHAISDLFDTVFSKLMKNEYYSQCWKKSIEAILKKLNKVDYSQSKSYRIMILLNCLSKIFEKIIATRLSHFVEHSNLLHNEQMRGRKNRSAIDASLCLLHDIQIAKKSKNIFSYQFLDVKDTFNHVSTDRLILILKNLKTPHLINSIN